MQIQPQRFHCALSSESFCEDIISDVSLAHSWGLLLALKNMSSAQSHIMKSKERSSQSRKLLSNASPNPTRSNVTQDTDLSDLSSADDDDYKLSCLPLKKRWMMHGSPRQNYLHQKSCSEETSQPLNLSTRRSSSVCSGEIVSDPHLEDLSPSSSTQSCESDDHTNQEFALFVRSMDKALVGPLKKEEQQQFSDLTSGGDSTGCSETVADLAVYRARVLALFHSLRFHPVFSSSISQAMKEFNHFEHFIRGYHRTDIESLDFVPCPKRTAPYSRYQCGRSRVVKPQSKSTECRTSTGDVFLRVLLKEGSGK